MLPLVSAVTIVLITLYLYVKYTYTYWSKLQVPFVRIRFPYGNFRPVALGRSSVGETYLHLYRKLKTSWRRYAGVYYYNQPQLMLLDKKLMEVMIKDRELIDESSDNCQDVKKIMEDMLSTDKLKSIFPTFLSPVSYLDSILINSSNADQPLDMKDVTTRYAVDVTSLCIFGHACNSLSNSREEFYLKVRKLLQPVRCMWVQRMMMTYGKKLCEKLNFHKRDPNLRDYFDNLIMKTISYRQKKQIEKNDLLQVLINKISININETSITTEQISRIAFIILNNLEIISSVLTFCIYEMILNQDIQDEVRKEIYKILSKYNGEITYDGIMEMKYLDNVIYETMRLHPPIPILHRSNIKKTNIPSSDLIIEKGTKIIFPIIGINLDSEIYLNPEQFDIQRFQHKDINNKFQFGEHYNLGDKLAMLQIKLGIIILLKNYRYILHRNTKTPIRMDPKKYITTLYGGLWVNVEKV